jgi:chaperonin GroEL (HSP60 family)
MIKVNTSRIEKRRSFYGYTRDFVKAQLNDMQVRHEKRIGILDSEIEMAKQKNNELKNLISQQERLNSSQHPSEEEMSKLLLQKHLETTRKVIETKNQLKSTKLRQEEELLAKRLERDKSVMQLKEGLQKLHSTVSEMGGV